MAEWIKLSIPHLGGKEKEYVDRAIDSTWIVPLGPAVDEFEQRLEQYIGNNTRIVALSAGTAAIHLGLILAGVKAGDEVICQSMTFAASANPIAYIGAKPVFVDSESDTWNIAPALIERAILDRIAKGRKPSAIVFVDLYGMPAKIAEISAIAARYEIPLIEDAAEAIGSEYDGKMCGSFGSFGVLSFNGNKMITTSGGGALICHNEEDAKRALFLATQARENKPYYYHETIGYNYRLSNVSAAIGCAQHEVLPERVARRRAICDIYRRAFEGNPLIKLHDNPDPKFNSNFWLSTILISEEAAVSPDQLRQELMSECIETRLLWRPMHMQPVFADAPSYLAEGYENGLSGELFRRGLCLPSSSTLTDEQIAHVAQRIIDIVK